MSKKTMYMMGGNAKLIMAVIAIILAAAASLGNNEDTGAHNTSDSSVSFTESDSSDGYSALSFRNKERLDEHYEKHGIEMGFSSAEEYELAAAAVVNSPDALYKLEAEDNDSVYFIEATGEIVFVSGDGYIRTYFIADMDYFDRQ